MSVMGDDEETADPVEEATRKIDAVAEPDLAVDDASGNTAESMEASSTDMALEELKTEVLSAVRGAITGVMSRHQPPQQGELALDFDFSLRATAEFTVEEPIETVAEAEATPAEEPTSEELPTDEPLELTDALTFDLRSEDATADLPASIEPEDTPLVPALPTVRPSAPRIRAERHWPAWSTAALLSVAGIAVGASVAILLVDPSVSVGLREGLGGDARDEAAAEVELVPENQVPLASASGSAENLSVEASPHLGSVAAKGAAAVTESSRHLPHMAQLEAPLRAHKSITVTSMEASVVALEPLTPAAAPELEIPPEATEVADRVAPPLSRAVRIASAGSVAAFAHGLDAAANAGQRAAESAPSAHMERLAALSPAAAVASRTETGGETPPSPALTVTSVEPEAVDTADPVSIEVPSVPLSAMARANEALRQGDVERARMLLQSESNAGEVEAMLALARSFDPNYLAQLGVDASKGKVEVAERLYRAWYDRSVELGLVSEGVNLNRLIRAMARAQP
ncbi:MAG: hypothetical protein R3D57_00360 [Hyphomicrobiaceae bacterium]